jgi:hypothetical protein
MKVAGNAHELANMCQKYTKISVNPLVFWEKIRWWKSYGLLQYAYISNSINYCLKFVVFRLLSLFNIL